MTTVDEVFAEAISSKTHAVQAAKNRLALMKKSKRVLKGIVQRLLDITANETIYIDSDLWDKKPRIHVSLRMLDSFKDDRLVRVLSMLTDLCPTQEVKEYAEYVNRDYTFKCDQFEAVVVAYVKSDSETCRKIKVGTETVQRDKFEIICD
jgi:hypothetical protein